MMDGLMLFVRCLFVNARRVDVVILLYTTLRDYDAYGEVSSRGKMRRIGSYKAESVREILVQIYTNLHNLIPHYSRKSLFINGYTVHTAHSLQ